MEELMIKGFILFEDGRIPFVEQNYKMELFSDNHLLKEFSKQYNLKTDYILKGLCFIDGSISQEAVFLVEYSMGSTCYLRCYTVYMFDTGNSYDSIGFQSLFLDDIFRYRYEYLDNVRNGVNLALETMDIKKVPFFMKGRRYNMTFRIGYDSRKGLLEDYNRQGEFLITLYSNDIQECNDLSMVLHRLSLFMTSYAEVPFKRIGLYKNGLLSGWFYSPLVSEEIVSSYDVFFRDLDVMQYVPKILNNLAKDIGNEIKDSVPLGFLGTDESMFSSHRFMEQMIAFEYLFDKLDHKKAQNRSFPLKKELKYMFDTFPSLLEATGISSDEISEEIKEIRHKIAHGYVYYYDFKNNTDKMKKIILMDNLLKKMSLLYMGFNLQEIQDFPMI